ncbi:glycerophosphodiester phosphodiesterase [Natronosporangium hydrolyticum]|uniref:Glycerophosphodiester phosphodiesterase n=1 Tax=Natronosporangium hydrolyticum TaxID=2811111 RepID=A0A895YLI8_9ACTN|nr:glycerophosphodiester phosphodiesterase family protein [Natronosporangium hydrolyticum]QSB14960.1 glycerophosphodiester phosphodiesterase [Natronosporangium hydrolyticum]
MTLVVAHRGASAALPEHTIGAYELALAQGADGLECDVRLTRDEQLVCLHDRRLERTSNGRGLVVDHTLAQLRRLDFGSWHGTGPARVLTLDQLLGLVRDAGRPVRLLIETKHPSRHGAQVERRLIALLHRHGLAIGDPDRPVQVTVMSFAALALRRIRLLAPALPTVQLLQLLPPGLPVGRLPFGSRIAGPGIELLRARPGLVPALRAAGHQVYVWTVNAPADFALVTQHGVDAVITDEPAAARSALRRAAEEADAS